MSNFLTNLKSVREKKGVSQEDLANLLQMSRQTYIAKEKGQSEFSIGEAERLADFFGVTLEEFRSSGLPDYEKYKQMLLFYLKQAQATGNNYIKKTKLAKLLYLADFAYFYKELESMSGMQYRRIQFGPVPDDFFRVLSELEDGGYINIDKSGDSHCISLSQATKLTEENLVKSEEKDLMSNIYDKWKDARTSEIVAFTHEQLPYKLCGDKEFIPYELITQEDPDHVY